MFGYSCVTEKQYQASEIYCIRPRQGAWVTAFAFGDLPGVKRATAFLLTWIAGFVDAVGFLHYDRVYTANMSGNSVGLGISDVSNAALAFRHGWPIAFFVAGLLAGRLFLAVGFRRQMRSVASLVFALEIGLAALAIESGEWTAVAALALAMGLQNAAFTRFGSVQVHSGFVTGTLLKATEYAVQYATWLHDRAFGGKRGRLWLALWLSPRQRSFRLTCELILLWVVYVLGASVGTITERRYSIPALAVPCALLLVLIAMDLRRPLSVPEQREQAAES
ncbi:MAG TPA: YoaK family protein [Bryobacteraceae bacterium]|jgi:uncharacterized membrane protein YoaK (UPF0700 family)|nr:YoaK family protein [Bryobacteraceae bacterium]